MITGKFPNLRLRRSRKYAWSRRLLQENALSTGDLVLPLFLVDGKNKQTEIKTMPGIYRYSVDKLNNVINNTTSEKDLIILGY